jgi:ketosteroid isomerase-like protein
MTLTNVEVVRGMLEAFIRKDAAVALAAFDPDVEWDGTNLPDGNVAHGVQAIVQHDLRWRGMWETLEVTLGDVIDAGEDRVIAFIHECGRSRAGIDVNERHSELYVVKEGKIVYRKGFSDADEAFVEVGVGRSPAAGATP